MTGSTPARAGPATPSGDPATTVSPTRASSRASPVTRLVHRPGWAMMTMVQALKDRGLYPDTFPPANVARKEAKGSEKRAVARDVLRKMDPQSVLIDVPEGEMDASIFAPELDYMILENCVWDIWGRSDDVDLRTKTVIVLGLLMGLGNLEELAEFVPIAKANGITRVEFEEFVYQAATYLGYPTGKRLRRTIGNALKA